MYEHRTYHESRDRYSDEWYTRTIPDMKDPYQRSRGSSLERPFHVHPAGYTPYVPESNRWRTFVDGHLGKPPRRPSKGTEWTIGGHLHDPAAVRSTCPEADASIVRQVGGPFLDTPCKVEDDAPGCVHQALVHSLHWTPEGHRPELERLAQRVGHLLCFLFQCVVSLNPRRRRTSGRAPIAASTSWDSSAAMNPRITETTPSCRLTG